MTTNTAIKKMLPNTPKRDGRIFVLEEAYSVSHEYEMHVNKYSDCNLLRNIQKSNSKCRKMRYFGNLKYCNIFHGHNTNCNLLLIRNNMETETSFVRAVVIVVVFVADTTTLSITSTVRRVAIIWTIELIRRV